MASSLVGIISDDWESHRRSVQLKERRNIAEQEKSNHVAGENKSKLTAVEEDMPTASSPS